MKILAPINELKDIISKEYADGKFLSALSVDGDNLQYTINGVNKLVTVPYATNAAQLDGIVAAKYNHREQLVYGQCNRLFSFQLTSSEKGAIVFRVVGACNSGQFDATYIIRWNWSETIDDNKTINLNCTYASSSDVRSSIVAVRRTKSLDGTSTITGAFDIFLKLSSTSLIGTLEILSYPPCVLFLTQTPILATADDVANPAYTSTGAALYSGTFVGSFQGNASSATYATNARITNTQPTTGTSYYPTFASGIAANTNYPLRGNDTIVYRLFEGTTDADGVAGLWLGNATASGTAGNAYGYLRLYGTNTFYTDLVSDAPANNAKIALPNYSGRLVYHTLNTAIGSANLPVYVDSTGKVTACSDLLNVRTRIFPHNTEAASSSEIPTRRFEGALYTAGMYATQNYGDANTPDLFGNIINLMGGGGGQIFASWNSTYKTGSLYYRSHRDVMDSGGWTPWVTILDSQNFATHLDSSYVKKSGDTMTGTLCLRGDTYPQIYGNGTYLILSRGNGNAYAVVFDATSVRPYNANSLSLGTSALRWTNVYSIKGDFASSEAGVIKLKRTITTGGAYIDYYHANQDTNYWRVGANVNGLFSFAYNGTELGLKVNTSGQLVSEKATGTAPFVVASTTLVKNLNADMLGGKKISDVVHTYPDWSLAQYQKGEWGKFFEFTHANTLGAYVVIDFFNYESGASHVFGRLHISVRSTALRTANVVNWGRLKCPAIKITSDDGLTFSVWMKIVKNSWHPYLHFALVNHEHITYSTDITFQDDEPIGTTVNGEVFESGFALKLSTPRTLWGQSFDGSANVSGNLSGVGNITGSGQLLISSTGTSNIIALRQNNNDKTAVVLNSTAFKPYDAANGLLGLGTTAARWKGIYGQTLDLSGGIYLPNNGYIYAKDTSGSNIMLLYFNNLNDLIIGQSVAKAGYNTNIYGNTISLAYGTAGSTSNTALFVNSDGNVGIGTTAPACKLDVNGSFRASGSASIGGTLSVTGATTFGNRIQVPPSLRIKESMGIATSYTDVWKYVVADSDGTTVKEYAIPHYGYSINWGQYTHTNGTDKASIGSFISDFFDLTLHTNGSIRFSQGSGNTYQVNALVNNSGLTVAKALGVGTNLTVSGASKLAGIVYAGSTIHTHNKTASTDGIAGTTLGQGFIGITGATPYINFYFGNSTTATSQIKETLAGTLKFGGFSNSKLIYSATDATMKVYSLVNSASTDLGNEMVAIQSCFDGADPETHDYVAQYEQRCNIVLQPRGGQVYVGYTPTDLQLSYALSVGHRMRLFSADNSNSPEILFYRGGVSSWKLINSSGTFAFQNNYTTAAQSTYFDVFKLSYNTGNATLKGNFIPMTTNVSNLGSSSLRWANAYLTNLNVSGAATITSVKIGDTTLSWDSTYKALKVDGTIYATGGVSSLGEGAVGGGGSVINVIDNLLSASTTDALSANQGRVLNQSITAVSSRVSSLSSSISSLQVSTFTGKSSDDGYTLTWFTASGGNRDVTIPTYDAISGSSLTEYDGTPCLVSPFLIDDIQAWVTNRGYLTSGSLSGYLNTSNTYFTQKLTSGTEIGTIRIGGKDTKIYAPVPSSGGNVDLSGYVTLDTQQTIAGVKTFGDSTNFNGDLYGYDGGSQTWDITSDGEARFATVNGYTLAAACAKSFTDSSSASAIGTSTALVTERDVYYGLPKINNVHNYNSNTNVYAPATGGATNQYLKGNGTTAAPVWQTYSTSPTSGSTALITSGAVYTALAGQKVTVTQTLTSGTAIGSIKVGNTSAITLYAPSSSGSGGGANLSNVTQNITIANNPNDIDYGSYYLYFDAGLSNKAYIYAMPYAGDLELHLGADAINVLASIMYAFSIQCEDVTQTSDIRYKEVLADMNIPLSKYAGAPSFKFSWTDREDGRTHIGSSAQYWQSVDPLFVSENKKDGKLSLDYTMVSYTGVITVAKETEDLKERVNILEKENVELKERIALLEYKLN